MEKIKYSYARLLTEICINSTKTFQTQASFLDEDPNMAYNNFIDEYSRVYNACFPLKVITGKLLNNCSSPWITPGLLKSINKKNRSYKKFIRSPSLSNEWKYKTYKNKLNHLIRIAKRKYYDTKFESAKNDLRTTWKLLNEVINTHFTRFLPLWPTS